MQSRTVIASVVIDFSDFFFDAFGESLGGSKLMLMQFSEVIGKAGIDFSKKL